MTSLSHRDSFIAILVPLLLLLLLLHSLTTNQLALSGVVVLV